MFRTMTRGVFAATIVVSSLMLPALASPANAATTKCSTDSGSNTRQITFSGSSEATFHVETCLELAKVSGGQDYWTPTVRLWIGDGDHDYPVSGPFGAFTITVWLQINNGNVATWTNQCVLPGGTTPLNAINDFNNPSETKYTNVSNALVCGEDPGSSIPGWGTYNSGNDFTTDGKITYTVLGKSSVTWQLNGSPGFN